MIIMINFINEMQNIHADVEALKKVKKEIVKVKMDKTYFLTMLTFIPNWREVINNPQIFGVPIEVVDSMAGKYKLITLDDMAEEITHE